CDLHCSCLCIGIMQKNCIPSVKHVGDRKKCFASFGPRRLTFVDGTMTFVSSRRILKENVDSREKAVRRRARAPQVFLLKNV
uniref:Uncharacterized protein n=1 Tax=Stegastes partitus TaxID=144197 RepID=A0A3B4ZR70_9TELE